jgi:hypothetical protein
MKKLRRVTVAVSPATGARFLDGRDDTIAVLVLFPGEFAGLLHVFETRFDGFQQIRLGNVVGRPDDTEILRLYDRQ